MTNFRFCYMLEKDKQKCPKLITLLKPQQFIKGQEIFINEPADTGTNKVGDAVMLFVLMRKSKSMGTLNSSWLRETS